MRPAGTTRDGECLTRPGDPYLVGLQAGWHSEGGPWPGSPPAGCSSAQGWLTLQGSCTQAGILGSGPCTPSTKPSLPWVWICL